MLLVVFNTADLEDLLLEKQERSEANTIVVKDI